MPAPPRPAPRAAAAAAAAPCAVDVRTCVEQGCPGQPSRAPRSAVTAGSYAPREPPGAAGRAGAAMMAPCAGCSRPWRPSPGRTRRTGAPPSSGLGERGQPSAPAAPGLWAWSGARAGSPGGPRRSSCRRADRIMPRPRRLNNSSDTGTRCPPKTAGRAAPLPHLARAGSEVPASNRARARWHSGFENTGSGEEQTGNVAATAECAPGISSNAPHPGWCSSVSRFAERLLARLPDQDGRRLGGAQPCRGHAPAACSPSIKHMPQRGTGVRTPSAGGAARLDGLSAEVSAGVLCLGSLTAHAWAKQEACRTRRVGAQKKGASPVGSSPRMSRRGTKRRSSSGGGPSAAGASPGRAPCRGLPPACCGITCAKRCAVPDAPRGRRAQVLQACALQLIGGSPQGSAQALALRAVCRRAHARRRPAGRPEVGLMPGARRRRFKEALDAPFWRLLDPYFVRRLWRALGRPGAAFE
jgi:hypothetical protein